MGDKNILHMLTPLKHVSPFDANMALDAGYDAVMPYAGVERGEIAALVQDAIFSRPPKLGPRTGFFFGGKDALLALDMLEAAKKAMYGRLRRPFCGSGGLLHHRRRDGDLRRNRLASEALARLERTCGRGVRRNRRRRFFLCRDRGAARRKGHPRRL